MLCPQCGNENREGAKFCDECGFRLIPASERASFQSESEQAEESAEPEVSDVESQPVEDAQVEIAEDPLDAEGPAERELPVEEAWIGGDPAPVQEPPGEEPQPSSWEAVEEDAASLILSDAQPTQQLGVLVDEMSGDAVALGVNLAGIDRHADDLAAQLRSAGAGGMTYRDGNTKKMPRLEGESPAASRDYIASKGQQKRGRGKKALMVVGVLVALAALTAFATYELQLWGGKLIPDVTGMTEADARSVLDDCGFEVRALEIKSDDTEGLVILSDPAAGTRVEENTQVIIHIATSREIPDVIGKTKKEAKKALDSEGFENIKFKKEKSDAEKGTVISTDPKAGAACKSTSKVVVKLATPYTVPDIAGYDLESAEQLIVDAGLQYQVVEVETEEYEDGSIMGTDPVAGSEVKKDSLVTIQIAKVRGPVLESLTMDYLDPGSEISIGFVDYTVESIESVSYVGNDTVEFVITASPYTHLLGQKLQGSKRRVSGTIVWTSDNQIAEIY